MNITLIPVSHVDAVWPTVADGFDRAVVKTGGDISVAELWQQARAGSAFLFVAHDSERIAGASLWRPETWQSGQVFRCLALYGEDVKSWVYDMRAAVKRVAGNADLISEGRRGWPSIFADVKIVRVLYRDSNP